MGCDLIKETPKIDSFFFYFFRKIFWKMEFLSKNSNFMYQSNTRHIVSDGKIKIGPKFNRAKYCLEKEGVNWIEKLDVK